MSTHHENFSDAVLADLRRSGIDHTLLPSVSPEELYAPFSTFRHENAAQLFMTKGKKPYCPLYDYHAKHWRAQDGMGMFLHYLHLEDHYYRFRNFDPAFTETKQNGNIKQVRYRGVKGEPSHFFLHPDDHALMQQRDDTLSCFWIEGEKKAWLLYWLNKLNAQKDAAAVIGSQGVNNFFTTPEWKNYNLVRKAHYIFFDADSNEKAQVAREEIRLAMALICAGNQPEQIYSVRWDPESGKGYDDYIVNAEQLTEEIMLQRHKNLFSGKPLNVFKRYAKNEADLWWGMSMYCAKYQVDPTPIQLNSLANLFSNKLGFKISATEFKQEFRRQYRHALQKLHEERRGEHLGSEDGKDIIYLGTNSEIKSRYLDIPKLADHAWKAIEEHNIPPEYFEYYGNPVFLKQSPDGLGIEVFNEKTLEAASYDFILWKSADNNGMHTREAMPSIIRHMLNHPKRKLPLPALERLVYFPYFSPRTKTLISSPGYHADDKTYAAFDSIDISLPNIISKDDALEAKQFIEDNLFIDFPFETQADKAHAFCLLFEPYVRSWMNISPIYSVEAPCSGHGKTKLVDIAFLIAFGEEPTHMNEPEEQEWGKFISSALRSNPTLMFFDNVKNIIKSGILCNAITSKKVTARILQTADTPTMLNQATWVITANQPRRDKDIAERTVRVRLSYGGGPDPNHRKAKDFKHYPLERWVKHQRKELLERILTMIQYWIQEGSQEIEHNHRCVQWGNLMGGILQALDIPGFLEIRADTGKAETFTQKRRHVAGYVPQPAAVAFSSGPPQSRQEPPHPGHVKDKYIDVPF